MSNSPFLAGNICEHWAVLFFLVFFVTLKWVWFDFSVD